MRIAPSRSELGVMTAALAKWLLVLSGVALAAAPLSPDAGRMAREKFHRIVDERLLPNEVLVFTEQEVNSFLAYEPLPEILDGISNVQVRILENRGLIDADVDWHSVQAAGESEPNLLLRTLLQGRRRVQAVCRFTSGDGVGVLEVESVDIGGVVLRGGLLDWLVEEFVTPHLPEFQPAKPMPLPKKLKQVRLEKGRAVVEAL